MAKPVRAGAKPRACKAVYKQGRESARPRRPGTRKIAPPTPDPSPPRAARAGGGEKAPAHKQSPPGKAYTFTPELMAWGKDRWENSDDSQRVIALEFRVKPATLQRYAEKWGWVRHVAPPRALSDTARLVTEAEAIGEPSPDGATAAPAAPDAATHAEDIDRLERALRRELEIVEAMRARLGRQPQAAIDAERTARTLANLTTVLFKVQRLRCGLPEKAAPYEDDMPADIDAFRDELARRIRAFFDLRRETGGAADA